MRFLFPLILLFWFATSSLLAQRQYLHCGKLISGTDQRVLSNQTIVVEDGKIVEVLAGLREPAVGTTAIDLKDQTVMPGLIDLHVHIESQSSKTRYLERFTMNPADVALRATGYCEKTLMAGFTTVRDLGGSGVNVSLRNAINAGHIVGPRIITAEKAIGTTGGHADPTNGTSAELMGNPGPDEGVINSPSEAYAAVRARYKKGADCIKITATGGVLSVAKDGSGPQFTQEEVNAIVAAANDYNMITAAHAHGVEGMKRAVIAGITTIEHGTMMNEEVMDLMIARKTYYVPTISAGKFVAEKAKQPGFYPAIIVPKALEIGSQIQGTFAAAYKRGVPIAFGTDTGVSYHGDNANEFIYMVEAGMPALEAILSATSVAGEVLRMEDQIGQIRSGLEADIIAVPGDPTQDVNKMTEVSFVMKGGVVYRHDK